MADPGCRRRLGCKGSLRRRARSGSFRETPLRRRRIRYPADPLGLLSAVKGKKQTSKQTSSSSTPKKGCLHPRSNGLNKRVGRSSGVERSQSTTPPSREATVWTVKALGVYVLLPCTETWLSHVHHPARPPRESHRSVRAESKSLEGWLVHGGGGPPADAPSNVQFLSWRRRFGDAA
jgi:hypothetical protein